MPCLNLRVQYIEAVGMFLSFATVFMHGGSYKKRAFEAVFLPGEYLVSTQQVNEPAQSEGYSEG